jgi:hypothetical protein
MAHSEKKDLSSFCRTDAEAGWLPESGGAGTESWGGGTGRGVRPYPPSKTDTTLPLQQISAISQTFSNDINEFWGWEENLAR